MGNGAAAQKKGFSDESASKIGELYDVNKRAKLGEGADGTVCKAVQKATGSTCAVKIIANSNLTMKHREEIEIMSKMSHPNIIQLCDSFRDRRNTYIVMELCSGGELFERIMGNGPCPEKQVEMVMSQIIPAVGYMHQQQVCHRDLKPENLMLMHQGSFETNQVKIIDFGLAKRFVPGEVMTTVVGSPFYVAPQVLLGRYNHLSDMWSCGVVMYLMLCGVPPFTGDTDDEILKKVKLGHVEFDGDAWASVSASARQLIKCLLKMKPSDRYCAEKASQHEWFGADAAKPSSLTLLESSLPAAQCALRKLAQR